MRRQLTALAFTAAFLLTGLGHVAAAPPDSIPLTLSDYTPHPGQQMTVWFKSGKPNYRIKVYIDTPTNPVGSVITSSTGYGKLTFTLSRFAKVGSRHALGLLLNPTTGANARAPFTVQAR